MSGFVFTFCVFPTSFNACYTGLLPEILQAMLECPKLGFYPKFCVDLVDLPSRDQKRQKAKPDIFTGTPFRLRPTRVKARPRSLTIVLQQSQSSHSIILEQSFNRQLIVLLIVLQWSFNSLNRPFNQSIVHQQSQNSPEIVHQQSYYSSSIVLHKYISICIEFLKRSTYLPTNQPTNPQSRFTRCYRI